MIETSSWLFSYKQHDKLEKKVDNNINITFFLANM